MIEFHDPTDYMKVCDRSALSFYVAFKPKDDAICRMTELFLLFFTSTEKKLYGILHVVNHRPIDKVPLFFIFCSYRKRRIEMSQQVFTRRI